MEPLNQGCWLRDVSGWDIAFQCKVEAVLGECLEDGMVVTRQYFQQSYTMDMFASPLHKLGNCSSEWCGFLLKVP